MSNGLCTPCVEAFQADRFDFQLDDSKWKELFSQPGGLLGDLRCISPTGFLEIRITIALLWTGAVAWSIHDWVAGSSFLYWLTKLTHWSALIELLYFHFAAYSTYMAITSAIPDGKGTATPWFVQITWFLGSAAPCIAMIVFIMYWVLVYDPKPDESPPPLDVIMHGGNVALAVIDMILNRQPYYVAHLWVPFTVGAVYCAFTYVYHIYGGTHEDGVSRYIYKAIDWSSSQKTGDLLGVILLFVLPLLYYLLVGLATSRDCCCRQRRVQLQRLPLAEE